MNTKTTEQSNDNDPLTEYYFWLGADAAQCHEKTMEKINSRKGVDNPDETYKDSLKEAIDSWGGVSGK